MQTTTDTITVTFTDAQGVNQVVSVWPRDDDTWEVNIKGNGEMDTLGWVNNDNFAEKMGEMLNDIRKQVR